MRWLTKANAPMNKLTLDQLFLQPNDRILEVGFGGGDLLASILANGPGNQVAGIDRSRDMVRVVKRRLGKYVRAGRLDVRVGDIQALPFSDGEFTKLCSVNTIYFWEDPLAALVECRRVLGKDGRLVLCINSKEDLEKWPPHKHGFRLYETTEVEDVLKRAGFGEIEVVSASDPEVGTFHCVSGTALSAQTWGSLGRNQSDRPTEDTKSHQRLFRVNSWMFFLYRRGLKRSAERPEAE